ncbi:tachykinin-like peptides receptor 86C [Dinothrombium tinctorium]|uniref:Tachykinin-like peptides receptor 86C n=1 Tax=Dinothrombium tinctorium TaxID=1965070 RepID=A0A3S3S4G7_9ACAR|nr:tachykinin-like peptides receptor 86C [Dinothrombium tinctorium]
MSNITHTTKLKDDRPFVPSSLVQFIWSAVFLFMVACAIIGNLIVIWIILAHRKMRTKTNVFLLNLAITDLMMATINAMFNFVYMLKSNWIFGDTYCRVNNFAANLTVASSVFTIMVTSIDRIRIF